MLVSLMLLSVSFGRVFCDACGVSLRCRWSWSVLVLLLSVLVSFGVVFCDACGVSLRCRWSWPVVIGQRTLPCTLWLSTRRRFGRFQ